ncbi:MAG: peptidylprolyl isomerase [Rhizobiaceae bacterium]|nr:peptidylprolyl isomerase [Rhizobiaceae bacterium]
MFDHVRRISLAFVSGAFLTAALTLSPAMAQDDTVVATINGEPVTEADIALAENDLDPQFDKLPADQRRTAALSALIEIRLLAGESRKEGVADDADFKKRIEFLTQRALHSAYVENHVASQVTDEAVRARYDKEIANTPPVNEIKASHILVKTEEEARAIIKALDEGADFAELAKEKSTDGAAANGGDLGFFGPGRMVPEFEKAAFALEVGAYSKEPVQTQFGYHVIMVTDKRVQQPPAFEQVKDQVRSLLFRELYFEAVSKLREGAEIEISDPALKEALEAAEKQ